MNTNGSIYSGPNRRKFVRVPFDAMIECKVVDRLAAEGPKSSSSGFTGVKSQNISASGLLIKSKKKFAPNSLLELQFTIPNVGGYDEVKVIGKVVRVLKNGNDGFYDNGIIFYKIQKKDEKAIAKFVAFLADTDQEGS